MLGIIIIFLLDSCHSKYLSIEIRTKGSPVAWNKDKTEFAFIAKRRLYRVPVGIARFPDGGMTKTEYIDFSLYHYSIKQKKLTHLIGLNEFYLGPGYRWSSFRQINLKLKDSLLFYKLSKPSGYAVKYLDEYRQPNFFKDISKTYSVNIYTHQKSIVDTTVFTNKFNHNRERMERSSARKYLSSLTYSDWGINLKEFYPQSKSAYMDYIVNGIGDSKMRQAIFEQIIPELTQKDCQNIIKRMQKQKQIFYKEFNKLDEKKDPYRRSIRKERYDNYILYIKEIKNKFFNLKKSGS